MEEANSEQLVSIVPVCKKYVLSGVTNKLHVLFQLSTKERPSEERKRPPFELAIVLDKSGSMRGPKLESCKTAIIKILENLAAEDKVHLVVYSTKVEVIFQNGNSKQKEELIKLVAQVTAEAKTNLCLGIKKGFKLLSSDATFSKRIFLFSDGIVNEGERNKDKICELVQNLHKEGVNTTALGIGADFDENLMKGIAESGSGDFFFINSEDEIIRIIGRAISGLLWTVGTDAQFKVRGTGGAIVKKIYGHSDVVVGAKIGDLKEMDSKQIVTEVELSPTQNGDIDVLKYELTFLCKETNSLITKNGTLSVTVTDDESLLDKDPPKVILSHKVAETAEHDLVVLDLLERGENAAAIKLQEKKIQELEDLSEIEDEIGFFLITLTTAKQTLRAMKSKKNKKEVMKEVQYSNYLNTGQSNYEGYSYISIDL